MKLTNAMNKSNVAKFYITLTIIFIISENIFGQINGMVVNNDNTPIMYANVIVKDTINKIIEYSVTDKNGYFSVSIDKIGDYKIEVSTISYETKKIPIKITTLNKEIKLIIKLNEKIEKLNEIIVNASLPISVKKDTINFKTKHFTNGTEQNVEDLLKKIPGLEIDINGNIKIGNQEIEKLMIDGDDLFEKGYKILSKNMPAYSIKEVELLSNYSNNRLLKGIEKTDKVALNLKLDETSKRIWFGNIETSIGNDSFYQIKGNLMNFGKKNKYYFLSNLNSIGYDATGDIENLIRPYRFDEPGSIGDNEKVHSLLNLSGERLNFKESKTNFNNARLLSLNAIFNPTKKLKIKTLAFFNWDNTTFLKNSTAITNTNGASFTNTTDLQLRNKKNIAFGKLDITYNISNTKMLESVTKYNNGRFNDQADLLFNGNATLENLEHQNSLFDQKLSYTNKYKNNKVLLLTGRIIDEKTPQNYAINQFFYQDLFPSLSTATNVKQQSTNQMQFVGVNAHILDRKENKNLLEMQLGNELRVDKIATTFAVLNDEIVLNEPENFQNKTSYHVNNLYLKSKYRLKINTIGIVGKLNIHQLFNRLKNNNISSTQNPLFINPSIGLDWKINERNKITTSYAYNTSNAKVAEVFSDFVLTNFRSFTKGTGNFNQLEASNITFNYQLGNWSDRFFANTFIYYSKNHDFFSTNTTLNQNFNLSEKIRIKDREFITISTTVDYYLKKISANFKIDLGYTKSEFKNSINNSILRAVTTNNYKYGLEIRSAFKGIFNYHIGTKWTTSEIETTAKNSFTDNITFLDISFVFNKRFDIQLQSEQYYFGNLQNKNTYTFLDMDIRYKLIKNKATIALAGKNLFNTKRFRNFAISDIGSTTSEYRLLPRMVLLKFEYRF